MELKPYKMFVINAPCSHNELDLREDIFTRIDNQVNLEKKSSNELIRYYHVEGLE